MSAWKGCWLGLLGFGPLQRYPHMSWSDIQRRMKTAPHHDGHPHLINQSMGLTETFFFFPKTKQNKTKRKKKERKRNLYIFFFFFFFSLFLSFSLCSFFFACIACFVLEMNQSSQMKDEREREREREKREERREKRKEKRESEKRR